MSCVKPAWHTTPAPHLPLQYTHSRSAKKKKKYRERERKRYTHSHVLSHRSQNKQTKAETESFVARICDLSQIQLDHEMHSLPTDRQTMLPADVCRISELFFAL